jgi:hypothetical protein
METKDSGSGNQTNFLTGFTFRAGDFQIAPNFLWQNLLSQLCQMMLKPRETKKHSG